MRRATAKQFIQTGIYSSVRTFARRCCAVIATMVVAASLASAQESAQLVVDPQGPVGTIYDMVVTPDGSEIITVGVDKIPRVWDAKTGELKRSIRIPIGGGKTGALNAVAISSDGRWLAMAGRETGTGEGEMVLLVDYKRMKLVGVPYLKDVVTIVGMDFSPDGKVLAVAEHHGTVRLWDVSELSDLESGGKIDFTDRKEAQILEGHTDAVYGVNFSPDGLRLVSNSLDGLLILWVRPDLDSPFQLKRVMKEHSGMVRMCDYSPEGKWIVSAGFDGKFLLWNGESGELEKVLATTKDDKEALVSRFSPDGTRILCTANGEEGSFILDFASGEKILSYQDQGSPVLAADWHRSGEYVVTCGGTARNVSAWLAVSKDGKDAGTALFDSSGQGFRVENVAIALSNEPIVAFGPEHEDRTPSKVFDFSTLTLRDYDPSKDDGNFQWEVYERNGKKIDYIDEVTLDVDSLGKIEYVMSEDGMITDWTFGEGTERVFVSSLFSLLQHGKKDGDLQVIREYIGHKGEIRGVSVSPDGKYLVSGGDDRTVKIWRANPEPEPMPVVEVNLGELGDGVYIRGIFKGFPADKAGLLVNDRVLQIDDVVVESLKDAVSYTATKDIGDEVKYRIEREGEELFFDLTVAKYMNPNTTVYPLASLFVDEDNEWVCWRADGFYHSSPGGEKYIGWHINHGFQDLADFYPSYVFRKKYHLPELVKSTVQLGNARQAFLEAEIEKISISSLLPPKVQWVSPAFETEAAESESVDVKATITSAGTELEEIKLLLNGKAVETDYSVSGNELTFETSVKLLPGENRLSIFARNENSGHTSEERIIRGVSRGAVATLPTMPDIEKDNLDDLLRPNLYVLSVGISRYEDASIPGLDFCGADADAIAEFFGRQRKGLFKKVEVKLLKDEEATEDAVQEGLEWLEENATQKDVVMIFLAAHGVNDERGNYYLLPHDGNPDRLRSTGVAWDDFADILGNLPSRVLMFLDTCHSGQLGEDLFSLVDTAGLKRRSVGALKSAFDPSEAIRELTSEENGVVIMAASTGDESSVEHADWGHGAFTLGLLEGLRGKADVNADGIIHLRELDFFISDRVKELTGGIQHPTTVKPSTISRLPIATSKDP